MRIEDVPKVRSHRAKKIEEGQGANALRFLGEGMHHDPFVLFDEYSIPPDAFFPLHPHSGFEGFQFLVEGSTRYEDGHGNIGTIGPGGARRFLCRDGFEHSERPLNGLRVKGFLLWVKAPKGGPSAPSIYSQVTPEEIPIRNEGGLKFKTIVGGRSPLGSMVPFSMEVIEGGGHVDLDLSNTDNAFLYISKGNALADEMAANPGQGFLFQGQLSVRIAISQGSLAVLARGRAMGGQIVQEGPFVRWT